MPIRLRIRLAAGVVCLLVAYALLVPGLREPMLSVSGTVDRADLVVLGKGVLRDRADIPPFLVRMGERLIDSIEVNGTVVVFDKTRSILQTARELHAGGHRPVALLILLFSVAVPCLKALTLLLASLPLRLDFRRRLLHFANATGKWSMADVFVIAVFVAFLAANGLQESRGLVSFESQLGRGFGFFTGYCLMSILGTQLLASALLTHWQALPGHLSAHAHTPGQPEGATPLPPSSSNQP